MKTTLLTLVLTVGFLLTAAWPSLAQDAKTLPGPQQKELEEISIEIKTLQQRLEQLETRKKELETQRTITPAPVQSGVDPFSDIRFPVVRVPGEQVVVVRMNGDERIIYLSGVSVKLGRSEDAIKLLNRELSSGYAYVRCLNRDCSNARVYAQAGSSSLNCKLLYSDLAFLWGTPLDCGNDDVSNFPQLNSAQPTEASGDDSYKSPTHIPGTDVKVKGYYRKDGTYVRPHTRSAPGRKN